jgi:hypothetical protein
MTTLSTTDRQTEKFMQESSERAAGRHTTVGWGVQFVLDFFALQQAETKY